MARAAAPRQDWSLSLVDAVVSSSSSPLPHPAVRKSHLHSGRMPPGAVTLPPLTQPLAIHAFPGRDDGPLLSAVTCSLHTEGIFHTGNVGIMRDFGFVSLPGFVECRQ